MSFQTLLCHYLIPSLNNNCLVRLSSLCISWYEKSSRSNATIIAFRLKCKRNRSVSSTLSFVLPLPLLGRTNFPFLLRLSKCKIRHDEKLLPRSLAVRRPERPSDCSTYRLYCSSESFKRATTAFNKSRFGIKIVNLFNIHSQFRWK